MKRISTLLVTALLSTGAAQATIVNISNSGNWSSYLPTGGVNDTIIIATGKTLTIDKSVTCQNCTFQGGNMVMGNFTLGLQYSGSANTTSFFTDINFTINGTGVVTVNAPIYLTNATFTFNSSANMTTSYQVDMVNSKLNLNGSSYLTANGGGTNFNMSGSSEVIIGDGTTTSTADFYVAGPTLNIYDNSNVVARGNKNNYENWANYNTAASPSSPKTSHTSFNNASPSSNMNCGGVYPKSCSNPYLYGPATVSSAGTVQGATLLPILLEDFTAALNIDKTITLSWTTAQESNASHFDIQRSTNGSDWNTIGAVQAKGNSASLTDYGFTDDAPAAGVNYYRLSLVDLDGNYAYSSIKVIRTASLVNNISFFPNPARDYVNVSLSQASGTEITVRLINQSGQVLQERKMAAGNGTIVSFPVQQYATGLYILSVVGADGTHETNKLLISHS